MQYTLIDLLSLEHILLGVNATDAEQVIRVLTDSLVQSGNAAPEFATDVWKREQVFPTGLPTQPFPIAIPHADPDHVLASAVCIGVLRSSVQFTQMGTDGSTVLDVRIVFLLAIKEREKQVDMIQQLMTLIQSPSLLSGLLEAPSPAEALDLIHRTLLA